MARRCWSLGSVVYCWLIFAGGITPPSAVAMWTTEPVYLGQEAGPALSIDIDSMGQPQIAYQHTIEFDHTIRSSGVWTPQGSLEYGYEFALADADTPLFTSRPIPSRELFLYEGLTELFGGTGLISSGPAGTSMWLDVDSQNRPHVGFLETTTQALRHAVWNGSSWDIDTVANDPTFQFNNTEFVAALDANDQVHFAWDPLAAATSLQYARPEMDAWTISPIPDTEDGMVNDMRIGTDGNVHLAYDLITGNALTGGLHYGVYDGSSWTTERITGLDSAVRSKAQVVLDPDGNPNFLTFDAGSPSSTKQLKHVYPDGESWADDIVANWNGPDFGPVVATADDEAIHIAYINNVHNVHYGSFSFAAPVPGDYDGNGSVGFEDYDLWRTTFGSVTELAADGNGDDVVDAADYVFWRMLFVRTPGDSNGNGSVGPEGDQLRLATIGSTTGLSAATQAPSVPEPASLWLVLPSFIGWLCARRRMPR